MILATDTLCTIDLCNMCNAIDMLTAYYAHATCKGIICGIDIVFMDLLKKLI
jgi:hypothetical protein